MATCECCRQQVAIICETHGRVPIHEDSCPYCDKCEHGLNRYQHCDECHQYDDLSWMEAPISAAELVQIERWCDGAVGPTRNSPFQLRNYRNTDVRLMSLLIRYYKLALAKEIA